MESVVWCVRAAPPPRIFAVVRRFVSQEDVPLLLLNHPNNHLHAVRYVLLGVPQHVFDLLDLLQLLLDHPSYLELTES